ncbi:MAG: AAA family ATPase [Muribaculaceae bacterium]|nr:AAA family ATPase [Muribaculaceae bacterium]
MEYIYRKITPAVERGAKYYPVVVITGPRQSGKSTLCRNIFDTYAKYNLEDIALRESIRLDPKAFLNNCGEKVIIDEVQHLPELLSYIQIIVDEVSDRRFILTGSSNFALMESITQSLPGRAVIIVDVFA